MLTTTENVTWHCINAESALKGRVSTANFLIALQIDVIPLLLRGGGV